MRSVFSAARFFSYRRLARVVTLAVTLLLLTYSSTARAEDAAAPTIRKIEIEIREVFEGDDLAWFYRAANSIKINTREEAIRRELLFKEGDQLNHFLIKESERNLRSMPFIRQVSILPVVAGDTVDVLISVQDTWTLFLRGSFTSGGGTSKSSLGVVEENLLGYGKRLELLYADDEGREKIEGVWDDRRLFGSYQQLVLGHFNRSDGYQTVVSWGRPFRTLVDPYSWRVNTDFFNLVGRLFENGDESYIYRQQHKEFDVGLTFPTGDPETDLRRFTLGYGFAKDHFEVASESDFSDIGLSPSPELNDPEELPDDRLYSGPLVSWARIQPDFLSINYVDRFERIQDFNLGSNSTVTLQFAGEIFNSKEDTLVYSARETRGLRLTPTSFARGEVGVASRAAMNDVENTVFDAEFRYYNVLGPTYISGGYIGKHTLAANMIAMQALDQDGDKQFLLGAENGLRGYEDRTFTGDTSFVVNFEDRLHFVDDVYQLVSIGGAIFADGGGTSTKGLGDIFENNFYSDIGVGLRLGFPRSSGGSVLRIDIAFPLRDGPDGSNTWEPRFLITTGQMFSAQTKSERAGQVNIEPTF